MSYDSNDNRILIDEGWYQVGTELASVGDEVWTGSAPSYTWSIAPTLGPTRMRHAVAYDSRDHQFVMFGGMTGISVDESVAELKTMTSGTTAWAAAEDSLTPPARNWHAMEYDPDWDRILVYGGQLANGTADGHLYELRFHDGPDYGPAPIALNPNTLFAGGTVALSWTAPGADANAGRAVAYDLRWSTSPINSSNFASATRDTTVAVPNWNGSAENHSVSGLICGVTYYFAIRAQDAWGNWGAMSNVVTASGDQQTVRPAPIALTGEEEGGYQSADLYWAAVGADSVTCPAAAYDLRRSQSTITEGNFNSATQVGGLPTPATPGTWQSMHVAGLGNCHLWYFAIKVRDAWSNWSAMSNVFSATTICFGDGTKPTDAVPLVLALGAPQPSPTAAGTTMRYDIPLKNGGERLDLSIYDVRGRLVKALKHDAAVPGTFTLPWDRAADDGQRARPGIYFIRMSVGDEQRTQTLILR